MARRTGPRPLGRSAAGTAGCGRSRATASMPPSPTAPQRARRVARRRRLGRRRRCSHRPLRVPRLRSPPLRSPVSWCRPRSASTASPAVRAAGRPPGVSSSAWPAPSAEVSASGFWVALGAVALGAVAAGVGVLDVEEGAGVVCVGVVLVVVSVAVVSVFVVSVGGASVVEVVVVPSPALLRPSEANTVAESGPRPAAVMPPPAITEISARQTRLRLAPPTRMRRSSESSGGRRPIGRGSAQLPHKRGIRPATIHIGRQARASKGFVIEFHNRISENSRQTTRGRTQAYPSRATGNPVAIERPPALSPSRASLLPISGPPRRPFRRPLQTDSPA